MKSAVWKKVLILAMATVAAAMTGCVTKPKPEPKPRPATVVYYSDYGAEGDGVTDDFDAIIETHRVANKNGWHVSADPGAVYYIGGAGKTAIIQTPTDWGNAEFIIDDTAAQKRTAWVFEISSAEQPIKLSALAPLKKNQANIGITFNTDCLVEVVDSNVKRYIRSGANQNSGADQTDVFIVDKAGNVDPSAPIIWDFNTITSANVYPIDHEKLVVRGGIFTTIANRGQSNEGYFARGLRVTRSNALLENITHYVTGEQNTTANSTDGSPYTAFIQFANCAGSTLRSCLLTGHYGYTNFKPTGTVTQGSYDLSANKAINLTVENCRQTNDINDSKIWGIFSSNYSKNITFDDVIFSRFDAHQGVANATIRNCELGWQGVSIIGCGTLLIENTKVSDNGGFVRFRSDYGSTWEGNLIIRSSVYAPANGGRGGSVTIIGGSNNASHDFGYECYLPRTVEINGLTVEDGNAAGSYSGPALFANFNAANTGEGYVEKYPFHFTESMSIKNFVTKSGKPYTVCANPYLFRNMTITQ